MGWHMSEYLADAMLNHMLCNTAHTPPADIYATLTTTIPVRDGSGTEVAGGGFARQIVTFGAAASGSITSTTGPAWSPLSTAADQVIVGAQLMDASTAGNVLFFYPFDQAVIVPANRDLALPANWATITRGTGALTNYAAGKWLDLVLNGTAWTPPATVYVAEFTTTVEEAGTGTEVTGGSYARQAVTFDTPSGGGTSNPSAVDFNPLQSVSAQNVLTTCLMDASTSGNALMFSPTTVAGTALAVPAGDVLEHAATFLQARAI